MKSRLLLVSLVLAVPPTACTTEPDGGPVTISIEQSSTSETTALGTFNMAGTFSDGGTTTEEVTFGGPLDQPPVPITFRRTLAGAEGSLVVTGSASLSFTSPTTATISGTWRVESGSNRYAGMQGTGDLSGSANFGANPPSASLQYAGTVSR